MCVNKLYIKNNKLDFNPLVDKLYNYVPCGKCEDCVRARSLQYESRAIAEFESVKSHGGCAFFYTLTYNDDNIPKFKDVNVFSKNDIQLFHKRLRKNLGSNKISWFLSSEYGHKTLRPHYHVIYYLKSFISSLDFYNAIKKSWKKGFIYPGNNLGLITDNRPFRYVAKYVQKDLYSFDLLNAKGFSKTELLDYKINKRIKYKNLDILPFHLQSNNFGIKLLSDLSYNNYLEGYYVRTDSLGISRKIPVPLYIYRKRFYEPYINSNGNVSYILNLEGINFLRDRIKLQYNFEINKISNLCDLVHTFYNSSSFIYQQFNSESLCKLFFENFKKNDLVDYVNFQLLYSRSLYCPFKYQNFKDDLDIYISFISDPLNYNNVLPRNLFSFYLNKFDWIRDIFELVERFLKYDIYLKNCYSYNARQLVISQRTGIYKPCYIKSISQFTNLNFNNLCLTTLTTRAVA